MPVNPCQSEGKTDLKWGDEGKCFSYTAGDAASRSRARQRAINQGIEIGDIGDMRKTTLEKFLDVTKGLIVAVIASAVLAADRLLA